MTFLSNSKPTFEAFPFPPFQLMHYVLSHTRSSQFQLGRSRLSLL